MLSVLYASIEERPKQKRVYMILICLLILSQDPSFNENIQKLVSYTFGIFVHVKYN